MFTSVPSGAGTRSSFKVTGGAGASHSGDKVSARSSSSQHSGVHGVLVDARHRPRYRVVPSEAGDSDQKDLERGKQLS